MSTVELTDSASDGVVAAVDELGVEAVAVLPDGGEETHPLALLARKLVTKKHKMRKVKEERERGGRHTCLYCWQRKMNLFVVAAFTLAKYQHPQKV